MGVLAYQYRVASNGVYGNNSNTKVHEEADFFSILIHAAMMSACHQAEVMSDRGI